MVEQFRWIEVNKQLPKDGKVIVVINADDYKLGGYPIEECMNVGVYYETVKKPGDYNSENVIWIRDGEESIYDYTHWVPLPQLSYRTKANIDDADKAE